MKHVRMIIIIENLEFTRSYRAGRVKGDRNSKIFETEKPDHNGSIIQKKDGFESEKILSKISVPESHWIGSSDYNKQGINNFYPLRSRFGRSEDLENQFFTFFSNLGRLFEKCHQYKNISYKISHEKALHQFWPRAQYKRVMPLERV